MEAVKVTVQTQPGFARGLSDRLPKIIRSDGLRGLHKGLVPLWGRQIPCTMMKFATFENTVELIYKKVMPTTKEECSKPVQLGVSFAGGYICYFPLCIPLACTCRPTTGGASSATAFAPAISAYNYNGIPRKAVIVKQ